MSLKVNAEYFNFLNCEFLSPSKIFIGFFITFTTLRPLVCVIIFAKPRNTLITTFFVPNFYTWAPSKLTELFYLASNRTILTITLLEPIVEYDLIRIGLEQESFVVTFAYIVSCRPLFECASTEDVVVLALHHV